MKNNLAIVRAEVGWTQKQLAKAANLDSTMIAHYESGRRSPSLENALRIVAAFQKNYACVFVEDIWEIG